MTPAVSLRQGMVMAGLLQGAAMVALHEWFKANGFSGADMVWAAPAYVVAVLGPITFNFLRGEFGVQQSLEGAAVLVAVIAATAAWFGWAFGPVADAPRTFGPGSGGAFVFGVASLAAWFVSLPFLQARLRAGRLDFPYPRLFDDAWRNMLLFNNCIVFAGVFWLLLALWAGLFMILNMGFFKDLFTSRFFIYLATAMAISFAISLEEKRATALDTLRRHLLGFQTRLLPLASLIVVLFLAALPIAGLAPVWGTGHATPLMLSLQLVIVGLVNAAWQDGTRPSPFSPLMEWLVRAALILLPVLTALCAWSLSLRVVQYGWSTDRVWAAILIGLAAMYALGYAATAVAKGWLPWLGRVNTVASLALIAVLLAVHTPVLDPQRIAATSQVNRLLEGKAEVEAFDFRYLRFQLGRAGDAALNELAALDAHPKAESIRKGAREALAQTNRFAPKAAVVPPLAAIGRSMVFHPAEVARPAGFDEYLHQRLLGQPMDHELAWLKSGRDVQVLAADLGGGPEPELIVLAAPYPVFEQRGGVWRQIGQMSFSGALPKPDELRALLERGDFAPVPREWGDLRLGTLPGFLQLRSEKARK